LATERYKSARFWDARYHQERMLAIWTVLHSLLKPADLFLDAGCGTGEYLALAATVPRVSAYGVDLSRNYLRRAQDTEGEVVRADVSHLPFRDSAFGVVLCSEVIEHIEKPKDTATELFRTAERSVVVTTPNFGLMRFIMRLLSGRLIDQLDESVGHVSIQKVGTWSAMLAPNGWAIELQRTCHVVPPILSQMHIPTPFARPVDYLEKALNKLLPLMGNISILVFRNKKTNAQSLVLSTSISTLIDSRSARQGAK